MENNWIDINDRLPNPGEYVLVSFENEGITLPDMAIYEVNGQGDGVFYPDDSDASYVSMGIFVSAWMPLPKKYERNK